MGLCAGAVELKEGDNQVALLLWSIVCVTLLVFLLMNAIILRLS